MPRSESRCSRSRFDGQKNQREFVFRNGPPKDPQQRLASVVTWSERKLVPPLPLGSFSFVLDGCRGKKPKGGTVVVVGAPAWLIILMAAPL